MSGIIDYSSLIADSLSNECILCDQGLQLKEYPSIIKMALFRKYSVQPSQTQFIKLIDQILNGKRTNNYV